MYNIALVISKWTKLIIEMLTRTWKELNKVMENNNLVLVYSVYLCLLANVHSHENRKNMRGYWIEGTKSKFYSLFYFI